MTKKTCCADDQRFLQKSTYKIRAFTTAMNLVMTDKHVSDFLELKETQRRWVEQIASYFETLDGK